MGKLKAAWTKYRGWPRWAQITAAMVVVFVVAGLAGAGGDGGEPESASSSAPAADDAEETADPSTTTTAEGTTTTTAAPTTTTTAPPQPKVYDGQGDQVLAIEKPGDDPAVPVIIEFTHNGSSNFAVVSLDAQLERIDLMVNTIGAYQGRRLADALVGDTTAHLEITADGAWHIEVLPLDAARVFSDTIDGVGDDVVAFAGPTMVGRFTHEGDSNFAVHHYTSDGRDLLINEIGPYDGTVPLRGSGLLDITANGRWTIGKG